MGVSTYVSTWFCRSQVKIDKMVSNKINKLQEFLTKVDAK